MLNHSYDEVISLCIDSLASFKDSNIKTQEHSKGLILCYVDKNLVKILIKKSGSKFRISIITRPVSRFVQFDDGRNLVIVETLHAYLREKTFQTLE